MKSAELVSHYSTVEEYLAAERISEQKHEYLAGVIYAMSGTTVDHERIATNVSRALGNQLSGKRCEVFSSNVKVRIRMVDAEFYYYPDAVVDCGRASGESLYADEPRVIFEVMSRESERIDRGEKLRNYQALPSLDSYVLIDQFQTAVTVYRRSSAGWTREVFMNENAVIELPSIECQLSLNSIYERTQLARG